MSIKIYNGYISRNTSLDEMLKRIDKHKDKIQEVANGFLYSRLASLYIREYDRKQFGLKPLCKSVFDYFTEQLDEIKNNKISELDFNAEISIRPVQTDMAVMLFCERSNLQDYIIDCFDLEYFPYQNQTDDHEGNSSEARETFWRIATKNFLSAAHSMLNIKLAEVYFYTAKELSPYVDSLGCLTANRAKHLKNELALKKLKLAPKSVSDIFKLEENHEYKECLKEIEKEIIPKLNNQLTWDEIYADNQKKT